jgi:ABC-2 type transport system ATP-binding protein
MSNDIDSSPAPTRPAPIATFDGVTRRYGQATAVDGLSLQIGSGETVALLGPNGAGKTTAVELLLGLAHSDAGVVRLFGGPPADAVAAGRVGAMLHGLAHPDAGRVGAMLQDAGLPQGAKVAELIGLVRSLYPDPLSVADALRLADLEQVAGLRVERLSGGQRQRVRLALSLAGNPELLILDEPTAALDVDARRTFWDRVRVYVAGGRTVLFATHRLEEADAVAGRVVVIAGGRLLADGTPDQVKAQAAGRSTISVAADGLSRYLLENLPAVETVRQDRGRVTLSTSDPDATIRALLQQAPHVQGLEVTQAGMEEAFRHLTRQGGTP